MMKNILPLIALYLTACSPVATSVPKKFNPNSGQTGGASEPIGAPGSINPGDAPFRDPISIPDAPIPQNLKTTAFTADNFDAWLKAKNESKNEAKSLSPKTIELTSKQVSDLRKMGSTVIDVTSLKNECASCSLEAAVALHMDPKTADAENTNAFTLQVVSEASASKKEQIRISFDRSQKTSESGLYADLITAVALASTSGEE